MAGGDRNDDTFSKVISPKFNIIVWLDFELNYTDDAR